MFCQAFGVSTSLPFPESQLSLVWKDGYFLCKTQTTVSRGFPENETNYIARHPRNQC